MFMKKKYDKIVFCDFDGTITSEDAFVHVCNHFAPKETEIFLAGIIEGKVSLKDGITKIVESIPSDRYPDMLDYVNSSKIRPGLEALIDYLDTKGIPFVVISGGLKDLVERQLAGIINRVESVYAADIDTTGEYLKIVSEFENGPELVNKTQVMDRYLYDTSVAIGDGITDQNMAMASSIVFARKHLAQFLLKQNHTFYSWEDFDDVKKTLIEMWG